MEVIDIEKNEVDENIQLLDDFCTKIHAFKDLLALFRDKARENLNLKYAVIDNVQFDKKRFTRFTN